MGAVITSAILVLLALTAIIVIPKIVFDKGSSYESRAPGFVRWAVSGLFLLIALVIMGFACTTVVQAKNVGVLTSFGKQTDAGLEPGLHFKLPWQKVTDIDATIKTDEYRDDRCIYVRIGDGSRSCLTITHRWQIVPSKAGEIYGNFRSNDPTAALRDAVVSTQLKAVAQDVLAKYNPISNLQVVPGEKAQGASLNFAPDYDLIAKEITSGMQERYGNDPLVRTIAITVSYLSLSESTQKKIDSFIAEVANTRIAAQQAETKVNEAAGNKALSASVSHDPNVLVSKCFDTVAEALKANYALPAGFSCWSGAGSVVIPGTR